MDYKTFFLEVADWINECNQAAVKYGMHNEQFWEWIVSSMAKISNKYGNADLVKRQMMMLYDWIYDVYQRQQL